MVMNPSAAPPTDRLTGALIGLARAVNGNGHLITDATDAIVLAALAASPQADPAPLLARVTAEKHRLAPDCATCAAPCGRTADCDMAQLWNGDADPRALKSLLLLSLRAMAASGRADRAMLDFFYRALFILGESWPVAQLQALLLEAGRISLRCTLPPDVPPLP